MTTTTVDPSGLRQLLSSEANDAWKLRWTLKEMTAHPDQFGYREVPGGSPMGGSRAPWNARAANLVTEFHQLVRELELFMTDQLREVARYPGQMWETAVVFPLRGGSDENTRLALCHVVRLGYSAIGEPTIRLAVGEISGWSARANATLQPELSFRDVPRMPGAPAPRCHWCSYQTLRWLPSRGVITCINPTCVDSTGARPQGQLTFDHVTLEPTLTWRDAPITTGSHHEQKGTV